MAPIELTAYETATLWQHRILKVAWELKFGISSATLMLKLLDLSNNDTAAIALANSVHWAVNGAIQLFGTPFASALSDTVGRKRIWAFGRLTKLVWFMGSLYATSMRQYIVACIVCWGVLDAGTLSVEEAAWADVFGSRPELSSQLKSANSVWSLVAGSMVGPVIGALISTKSSTAGFYVASAMCVVEAGLVLCTTESLKLEERKPFALTKVNPFANIGLLFRNGRGLRRLGISAGLLRAVVTVYSTIEPFRLGPLGWTPAEQSAYSSVLAGANGLTTLFVAKPLIAAWGTRSVYELGSLAAAISYVGLSQSCRPGDASHMRKTIQFCICKIALMTPWSEPAYSAIGPMIIKQGMAVTDAGRGELASAYDGLASALGIFTPFLWANLYAFFERLPEESTLKQIFGPGGHFIIAALFRLASYLVLRSVDPKDLFIEDEVMNKPSEEPLQKAAKPSFPATNDDISIEWLDTVVPGAAEAGGVKSFEVEPVGQGVIGDAFKISVSFAKEGGTPAVVLKMSKDDETLRKENVEWYAREIMFYKTFADKMPIKIAQCLETFIDEETGAHCIVMEDCMSMEGGEVTSFPYWMMGNEEDFVTKFMCDLAKLHAGFVNDASLDAPSMKVMGVPEWMEGQAFTPGIAGMMSQHWDTVTEADVEFIGCEAGIPNHDAFQALLLNKKDVLKFSFELEGTTYTCGDPDAPAKMPNPIAYGERGKRLTLAILEKMGSRKVQTLIHGDGHPGNLFYQEESDKFTWIDWQAVHKGPPGWELSQGLPLALNGATGESFKRVVT